MDISIITIAFSAVTTVGGAFALFLKHLREKRQREAEQVELEHLKERVVKLEDKCAKMGDIENLKSTISELKDTTDGYHKESKTDRAEIRAELAKAVQEKREDVIRIYDRMEKLYEKVLEWLTQK